MSAASDLLSNYQHVIDSLTLLTGSDGIFDVEVNGTMLYSKHASGRHAQPGEVLELFRQRHATGVKPYGE